MTTSVYLDHAAATPVDSTVLAAMLPYYKEKFYNPSALYLGAKEIAKDVATARETVAQCLGVRPVEIVFTAGGTEANNLAVRGVMEQYPDSNIVVSAIEHESVLVPALKYDYKLAPVSASGHVDLQKLEALIDDQTVLVSVMYANNEIGTVQPLNKIATLLQKIREERALQDNIRPILFHVDACQAGNCLDLRVHKKSVDMMTLNGGKIYGPKQSGALYVRSGVVIKPQILGGGQERGLRSGTENVANIVGFANALTLAQSMREAESARLAEIRHDTIALLLEQIPSIIINGSKYRELLGKVHPNKMLRTITNENVIVNTIHLTIPGHDNERLIMELDELGIQCATGSACSASSEEPSHVLQALGLTEAEIRSSIRLTMGRDTTQEMMNRVVESLAKLTR